ncbi:sugar ABC transporter ATP-binding protein [Mesorhizobium sp. YC-39]|uniref:sugar ABC transporter ATP-binding protein n=1 Tax=unclassified Mesorhizobium TaxID=325217 RepID=UPI0021E763F7|nr:MULTISPECIES: sugar ABC transporter ATP-binding protein [unclassified Mesorhizobium]MCV3206606.1 sugar ABC transporter ATP-binding protein [Mesorhizobium sp. YC-2]MCV3226994.1 sugar ABC transporter ATP-binding protein [Mesorhizobium sp. YC-39]
MSAVETYAAEAHGINKRFGPIEVLHDVGISIPVGDARALVGRNGAGKSTLVGLLTGLYGANAGEIRLGGRPAPSLGDRQGWRERVACVYQRWMVIPHLTVAENLFLNNQPRNGLGLVDWRRLREESIAVLDDWGLDVAPDLDAWRLTVEQRQIVEIARALLQGSRFIILDEPTAELERREVNRLFERIRGLQEQGVTFLYISHHLEEIYEICRTVSVMRDGRVVADARLDELPKDRLVAAMVGEFAASGAGRKSGNSASKARMTSGLDIGGLTVKDSLENIDLSVHCGECVGLAGLAGSGKDKIAEAVAGLLNPDAGSIAIHGTKTPLGDVGAMRAAGVGYVARDRHVSGLFPLMSLGDNLTTTVLPKLGPFGFVSTGRQSDMVDRQIAELGIVAASGSQPIGELSGGNQQKAMVGRALASDPKVLVLAAPTQGVDIASKDALYRIINAARDRGMAVLVVSDDLDELAICDRVEVIFRGRLTRSFARGWSDQDVVAAIEGLY